MHQVPSDPTTVVVMADFDAFSPEELYDHFTQPELLKRWWPKVVETDLTVGGAFRYSWPESGFALSGKFLALDRGIHLAFTWAWEHGPQDEPLRVDMWFDRVHETGARLGIYHGPFPTDEQGQIDRQSIAEGWIHFSMLLAGLAPGASD